MKNNKNNKKNSLQESLQSTIKVFMIFAMAVFLVGIVSAGAPYPYVNGSLIGSDLSQIFIYVNSITSHMFSFFLILSFFLIILLSSMLWSFRTSGRIRLELHFAAASFSTFGLLMILAPIKGFVSPLDFFLIIGLAVASVLWIFLSNPTENY